MLPGNCPRNTRADPLLPYPLEKPDFAAPSIEKRFVTVNLNPFSNEPLTEFFLPVCPLTLSAAIKFCYLYARFMKMKRKIEVSMIIFLDDFKEIQ
jgi:hypothetical protein